MGGGSPTYNYPEQPSYGEGMADALKAQVELLTGTGDFQNTGSLESLLPLEENVRKKTAQTDTDVLKQTLLGSTTGGEEQEVTYDDKGRIISGFKPAPNYTIRTKVLGADGKPKAKDKFGRQYNNYDYNKVQVELVGPNGKVIESVEKIADGRGGSAASKAAQKTLVLPALNKELFAKIDKNDQVPSEYKNKLRDNLDVGNGYFGGTDLSSQRYDEDAILGATVLPAGKGTPIYAKDKDGNIIEDASKAGMTETITLPPQRLGDGMIDLLGDKRNIQATQADVDAGLANYVGEPRKAGFDKDGEFIGLAALSEDIQRGNLSRQREADLADVERLSDRYQDVMADYKPAATSGLDDARILLEQQRENLTGLRKATQADVDAGTATEVGELFQTGTGSGGPVTIPTTDTFGGEVTAATMDAAQVADPLQLQANTQFQGELATGADNQDTLRSNLLGDAKTALDTGLTDREQAQIANAARARQTLMGRTFDQSGAIAEAEARVQEDNARRMQNRSFAQSVLGQEAGLQQGDITRGMAQESEQAGLQQRTDLAQAQMDQQANAFGAQSTQQARMANQAQRQQANQFGVGATMDAERLNETLRQQGLSNYINAVGNLAQMEDQYMLDPFQALLGRGGGNALQQGQSVFGQANYGLSSGPQYLNPEAGLGYISNMAANQANMYAANVAADASRSSGLMGGIGAIGGGLLSNASLFCWVAREVYGPTNPAWMQFREWMFTESPQWFFELYRKYGERFASWISDKPRLKGIIRKWMDSKIGDK
jgi:hypothetical protein